MRALIVVVTAAAVLVAGAIAFVLVRRQAPPPDAFAGAYPTAKAAPTGAAATWAPKGTPAGPLPTFRGQRSSVIGRITDSRAGVSYPRFGPPWRLEQGNGSGEIIDSKKKSLEGYWYVSVESAPLDADLAPAAKGPDALRAAAELSAQKFVHQLYDDGGKRTEIAGAPMTARGAGTRGRNAWVTAFRIARTDGERRAYAYQTRVFVAVDAGRTLPAVVEIAVPSNQRRFLPDINAVVGSLRVVG